ncbi:unnamed protein product [Peniophora sp. CBMAI 1063]|nr:unnamed protein product [Peniophora sp. CBMAI 1063]
MPEPNIKEGKLPFAYGSETYETYYKVVGNLSSTSPAPLIFIHGAPGSCHDYGIPLYDIATGEGARPVIFYDQIGSSRSTHLPEKPADFWTFDVFIAELQNLVRFFHVEDAFHLLGHSWGGQIAAELIVRHHPKGLKSVMLSNTLTSSQEYRKSVREMEQAMGDEVWLPIEKHEREKTTEDPEYIKAMMTFYEAHACRLKPFPQEIIFALSQKKGDGDKIWEAIKDNWFETWSVDDRIHLMDVPALLINGRYDYMSDVVCGPFFWKMDKVKWIKFAESSHMPFWEERERYMTVVRGFMYSAEQKLST